MGMKERMEAYLNSRRKFVSVEEALAHPRKKSNFKKYAGKTSTAFVVTLSLLLLIVAGVYTGYITYHEGRGGYIYGMNIYMTLKEYNWAGNLCLIWSRSIPGMEIQCYSGSMTEANVFFDCFQRE
jgi:hypothetical protein